MVVNVKKCQNLDEPNAPSIIKSLVILIYRILFTHGVLQPWYRIPHQSGYKSLLCAVSINSSAGTLPTDVPDSLLHNREQFSGRLKTEMFLRSYYASAQLP